jgi:hypothetical protein
VVAGARVRCRPAVDADECLAAGGNGEQAIEDAELGGMWVAAYAVRAANSVCRASDGTSDGACSRELTDPCRSQQPPRHAQTAIGSDGCSVPGVHHEGSPATGREKIFEDKVAHIPPATLTASRLAYGDACEKPDCGRAPGICCRRHERPAAVTDPSPAVDTWDGRAGIGIGKCLAEQVRRLGPLFSAQPTDAMRTRAGGHDGRIHPAELVSWREAGHGCSDHCDQVSISHQDIAARDPRNDPSNQLDGSIMRASDDKAVLPG